MCVPPDVCCMLWTKLSVLTQPSVPPVVCIGHLAVLSCKIVQHCASTHCIVTSRHGPRTAALLRRLKRSDGSVELGQHQIQLGLVPLHRLRQTRAHTQRQTRQGYPQTAADIETAARLMGQFSRAQFRPAAACRAHSQQPALAVGCCNAYRRRVASPVCRTQRPAAQTWAVTTAFKRRYTAKLTREQQTPV